MNCPDCWGLLENYDSGNAWADDYFCPCCKKVWDVEFIEWDGFLDDDEDEDYD